MHKKNLTQQHKGIQSAVKNVLYFGEVFSFEDWAEASRED